jgi:mono/diheme cytochrome c family protein
MGFSREHLRAGMATAVGLVAVATLSSLTIVHAQQSKPAWDGAYSEAQAKRGEALYAENCASCHGRDMAGGDKAPAAAGAAFVARWQGKPLKDLFEFVQSKMPYNSPGGLSRTQNADILALMLRQSKVPSGQKDLVVQWDEGEAAARRTDVYYTEDQAARGKVAFNRNCGNCHNTVPSKQTLEEVNKAPLPSSFAAPFLQRVYYGHQLYPSVFYLFSKLESMPAFDTESISANTRADIIAHILKANGYPAGREELRPEPEAMKQMVLGEPDFERIFNGRDFTGMKFVVGPNCQPAPQGCGRTEPGAVLKIDSGKLICKCNVHSYWYTEKKYQNFTLRFQHRFIKPPAWEPGDNSELYMGGGGFLLFIADNYRVWPKSIEVEGRWRDFGDIFFIGGPQGKYTYDNAVKVKAGRSPWEWNDVEIVSKGGQVRSYLNGTLVSTITEHGYPAGHIGFQMEGSPTEWRNLRVRVE